MKHLIFEISTVPMCAFATDLDCDIDNMLDTYTAPQVRDDFGATELPITNVFRGGNASLISEIQIPAQVGFGKEADPPKPAARENDASALAGSFDCQHSIFQERSCNGRKRTGAG